MEKIILPLPLFNWNTRKKTLWKGGMQFKERMSFHPFFAIGNQLLVIQEWTASLEEAQLYISLCQWDWNPPTSLGLSQSWCCYKLCAGAIVAVCWGMSNVLCLFVAHVWPPRVQVAKCDCTQHLGLPRFPPPVHSAPRPRLANGKG